MKKEYNNLTVENLTKTEWFNQFNKYQQEEILKGLKSNIDVLIYAKKEFDYQQMEQIRKGLEENLDVSWYAKPEIKWDEMSEIKEKLLEEKSTL